MKNRKYLILALIFLGIALLGIYLSLQKLQNRVDIVVAKTDIYARTPITSAMLDSHSIVETDMPAGAIKYDDLSKVIGKSPSIDILRGEFVSGRKLGLEDEKGQQLTVKTSNTREAPVPLKDVFVPPTVKKGDYVDIIVSFNKESAVGAVLTKTILQQVEVVDKNNEFLTIVLGPEDCETFYFALENGHHVAFVVATPGSRITTTYGMLVRTFLEKFNFIVTK